MYPCADNIYPHAENVYSHADSVYPHADNMLSHADNMYPCPDNVYPHADKIYSTQIASIPMQTAWYPHADNVLSHADNLYSCSKSIQSPYKPQVSPSHAHKQLQLFPGCTWVTRVSLHSQGMCVTGGGCILFMTGTLH